MISNTAQVNTFVGGMDMDTDINLVQNNRYRYAENIRVITNDNGTTGVLQNIEGVRKYSTLLPDDETVIGTTTVNDMGIIITKLKDGYNKVYRIQGFDINMPTVQLVCKGKLNLIEQLSVIANYESDTNVKVYFTDGNSPVKMLNVMSNKYHANSNLVDSDGNIKNPNAIELTPSANLNPFKFVKLSEGNLKSGVVSYCYQLFNVHGLETVTSPLSELIHLTESTTNQGSQKYKGTGLDKPANKSVTVSAKLNIKDFDKFRIIRLHYSQNKGIPTISIVDEADITQNQTEISYTDYGSSYLSELTIDEFNALTGYQFLAQTLTRMQNRLFAANITEQSWIPKTEDGAVYDARAYRANNLGNIRLLSASNDKTITINIDEEESFYRVPYDHDCINPFNTVNFNESNILDRYIYGKNSKLGGYGINIEYSFITTDIKLSKQQQQFRLDQDCTMDVPAEKLDSITITRQSGSTEVIDEPYAELDDYRIPNYADPYIDAKLKGYQRDEVYRFGIIFYNEKSVASPVLWIGDIRMPRASQMPPFVYENNTLIGKALGIEFKIKNMPKDAASYEIVRCDRTEADRTVIMQAVGSFPYEYRIQEQDKHFGIGSELKNSIEMRPTPFFMNVLQDVRIYTFAEPNGEIPYVQQAKDYFRLVSPEICVQGEDIETLLKNNCYLDIQGAYASPVEGGLYRDRILQDVYGPPTNIDYSQFAVANYILQPDGTQAYQDTINYVYIDEEYIKLVLPFMNSDGKKIPYQPIIAKYFIPRFDEYKGTSKVEIEDAKYPLNIDYNTTTGITAYRINIGERSYTNYSMSEFVHSDEQSIVGPAGPCIVIHAPNLQNMFTGYNRAISYDLVNEDIINQIPVFNIKRNSSTQYGGNTFSSRQNSVYISTSSFNSNFVFGGDTYLSLLDYPNTMIFQHPDLDKDKYKKYFIGSYIPFESSINMNLFHGDQAFRSSNSSNYLDSYLQLNPTQMGQWHTQDLPYYVYNSVYSTQNTGKLYVPNSMYAEENTKYSNRIMSSQAKTNNEVIDSFTKFKVADYLDVDNQYGDITNLKTFKDRLFYFQDSGVGIASVNERSLITDDNINQVVLGTGGILARYDYITNTNGDSVQNDRSIVNSDNVLYWYDYDKNEICAYTGQVSQISKEKQVQTHLNSIYKNRTKDNNSLFDKKYNEVWFRLSDKSLIFNEQLGRFTSFYTFNPKYSLTFSDRVVGIKDQSLYSINDTNTNGVDTTDKDAYLQLVVNKDSVYTKVYDNVRLQGQFKDKDGNVIKDNIIESLKLNTKNQEVNREQPIVVDYREDTYRFSVPRADKNNDELSLPARMRGKYMVCDYHFNGADGHTFEIPQITTTYRYSLI